MTIDVWMQHPTPSFLRNDIFASLLRWTGQTIPEGEIPIELTLGAMDAASVGVGLLSAWYGPNGAWISNDEVAALVRAHPTRFHGLASVNVMEPMTAVRELRRAVKELGMKGLRLLPWLFGLPPNDRRYYPVYAACIDAGVPFCTQIGHTGPLRRSETGRMIPYLEEVMLEFPELVVVGGHVGFPWLDELTTMTVKFPNFYVDTSTYALHRLPEGFVSWMKGVGRDRVMFGTNWPMISPAQCLKGLDGLGLNAPQREAFLSGTARRVFNLGAA